MYRGGLDRFKKAQTLEPFAVQSGSGTKNATAAAAPAKAPTAPLTLPQNSNSVPGQSHQSLQGSSSRAAGQDGVAAGHVGTQVGGGQSTWQPPDWAIEPRPGVYYLDVMKDGEVIDRINLDKRRHIFGRQVPACDFVLDHQSVSRQHAAVIPHRNGSIYIIDLGSVHGTFVANERLTKDNPVELEVGQSLRFAASTRTYILRKNTAALFPTPSLPSDVSLPSPPDPNDEDAVVAYNTILNRYGIRSDILSSHTVERPLKRSKKMRVSFRDQVGGELTQVVGISDGADVETEPGPIGVKEGSLVGKYESLVQVTIIPKGKETTSPKESTSPSGVTDKLQEVLKKVKSTTRGGIYDDLYGDSFPAKVGSSWAYNSDDHSDKAKHVEEKSHGTNSEINSAVDSDDLFGDS
ncbi:hypothetical protein BS78_10G249700 [Paspalum vaginatum]|nr:hypothetical protein BS78_10G249700 [Paspalum vaginatum]KAJ1260656.1 hypothetical protein BS78_10G249700 [Paspalum vaginatum]